MKYSHALAPGPCLTVGGSAVGQRVLRSPGCCKQPGCDRRPIRQLQPLVGQTLAIQRLHLSPASRLNRRWPIFVRHVDGRGGEQLCCADAVHKVTGL